MNQVVEMKISQPEEESLKGSNVMTTDPSETGRKKIATAAHYKTKARGSQLRYKLEDWLAAKAKFDESV